MLFLCIVQIKNPLLFILANLLFTSCLFRLSYLSRPWPFWGKFSTYPSARQPSSDRPPCPPSCQTYCSCSPFPCPSCRCSSTILSIRIALRIFSCRRIFWWEAAPFWTVFWWISAGAAPAQIQIQRNWSHCLLHEIQVLYLVVGKQR